MQLLQHCYTRIAHILIDSHIHSALCGTAVCHSISKFHSKFSVWSTRPHFSDFRTLWIIINLSSKLTNILLIKGKNKNHLVTFIRSTETLNYAKYYLAKPLRSEDFRTLDKSWRNSEAKTNLSTNSHFRFGKFQHVILQQYLILKHMFISLIEGHVNVSLLYRLVNALQVI